MKKIYTLIISVCLISQFGFSQIYPISSYEFGYFRRSHSFQLREVALVNNTDGTIIETGDFKPKEQYAISNVIIPCNIRFSLIDFLATNRQTENKKFRFGDYWGLIPIYAGKLKLDPTTSNPTSDEGANFGFDYSIGAFALYNVSDDLAVGMNYKWNVVLDGFSKSKSFYSYYYPNKTYGIFAKYKQFALECNTTISKPNEEKMIKRANERAEKNKVNAGIYGFGVSQSIDFKYLLSEKAYITCKYSYLKGLYYLGNQNENLEKLNDNNYPYTNFAVNRKDFYNTLQLCLGINFN